MESNKYISANGTIVSSASQYDSSKLLIENNKKNQIKTHNKAKAWKYYFGNNIDGRCVNCEFMYPFKIPNDVKKISKIYKNPSKDLPEAQFVLKYELPSNSPSNVISKNIVPVCYQCYTLLNDNLYNTSIPMDTCEDYDYETRDLMINEYIKSYLIENGKCIYNENSKYCCKKVVLGQIRCNTHYSLNSTQQLQYPSYIN